MIVPVLAGLLVVAAAGDRAPECKPRSGRGTAVVVDEVFKHVTMERFVRTYFSEAFNDAAAPVMGIKSRDLVSDVDDGGVRLRTVRMRPAVTLPGPLRAFGSDDQVRYDEVSRYDTGAHKIDFFIATTVCRQLRYGGTIAFREVGDGVRLHIDAVLQVDAPIVGPLVEAMIKGGVRDGYVKLGTFMQRYLDRAPATVASSAP